MTIKLIATMFRWIARVFGTLLVGLTVLIAVGEGMPNPFTQPFVVQIGFVALALLLIGIIVAWRWELPGGIVSLIGGILFIGAEELTVLQTVFISLLGIPSLLFVASSLLRWHYESHKAA